MILRSIAAMSLLNVAKAAAALLISVAIASRVAPSEFGLVAFSIPLMAFLTLLTDLGLSSAIVRHTALDRQQTGAVVSLLGLAGLGGAALLALSAGALEHALHLPGLTPVLLGFAWITAMSIWATAPRALLERGLAYPRIAAVEAVALLGGLAVFAAVLQLQAGVLALVAYHATLQTLRALLFTRLAWALFELSLRWRRIASLLQVGGWVLANNLLSFAARNADRMLIAPVLGATALGLYGLAYQFMTIPLVLLSWPVSGVLLSALSRLRHDPAGQREVTAAVLTGTATFSLPLMAYLMLLAPQALAQVYAQRWAGLSTLVMLLAPAGMLQSLAVYCSSVLLEAGRHRLNFLLGLLWGGGLTVTFVASVSWGLNALTLSFALVSSAISLLMIVVMCRSAGLGAGRFARCLLPGGVAALAGSAAGLLVQQQFAGSAHGGLQALLAGAAFVAAALAACALLRGRLLDSGRALVRARLAPST
ncbi:MAG: hypothetical protein DI603_11455 [Roseateles depolymerans]|uniref:Polysaccharide biosynthesis protein n=1 Tax=Roseateles depolymerans TaxID=76731 RepID=A0A2W5FGS1_9BURK|nr:MAG: hypothetical protein DI603_11455 [Roseateles depolymerans]